MSQQSHEPTEQHIESAINWQLLLAEDTPSASNQSEFDAWLRQDPRHLIAWQRIHAIHQAAATPLAQAALSEVAALHQQNVFTSAKAFLGTHVQKHKGIITVLCFLGLSFGYANQQQWPSWVLADYRSAIGDVKIVTLTDGSQLTLGSGSAVDVVFDQHQRQIILRRGEVFADVAKDSKRPFVIDSPQGSATALGTQFSVQQLGQAQVKVTVVSSVVNVCAHAKTECQRLQAEQSIALTPQGLSPIHSVDVQAETAWRDQMVIANDMPLSVLLDIVKKHHQGVIIFNQQTFQQHRVSGVFPLNNPNEVFAALQSLYPLSVKRYGPYITALSLEQNPLTIQHTKK